MCFLLVVSVSLSLSWTEGFPPGEPGSPCSSQWETLGLPWADSCLNSYLTTPAASEAKTSSVAANYTFIFKNLGAGAGSKSCGSVWRSLSRLDSGFPLSCCCLFVCRVFELLPGAWNGFMIITAALWQKEFKSLRPGDMKPTEQWRNHSECVAAPPGNKDPTHRT